MKFKKKIKKKFININKFKLIITVFLFLINIIINNFYIKKINFNNRILIFLLSIIILNYIRINNIKENYYIQYIRNSQKEIYNINWPTFKQTIYNTIIIVLVTFLSGILLFILDNIISNFILLITYIKV